MVCGKLDGELNFEEFHPSRLETRGDCHVRWKFLKKECPLVILRDKLGDELFWENFTRVDMSHGAIAVYFEKKSLFKG